MRVIFAGTMEFSTTILEAIMASKHEVIAVITQPDKARGRHRQVTPPPVKTIAEKAGIKVLQPVDLSDEGFKAEIAGLSPGTIAVAAYGRILPKWFIEYPPLKCINVHASLLPKYRGAAPIRRALMNGEKETGVTIMEVVEALDAGPVYLEVPLSIHGDDDAGTLQQKLAQAGARALIEVLDSLERGDITPLPQDESKSTYADKIAKEDYDISWDGASRDIVNKIRALAPAPGAKTMTDDGLLIKILKAKVADENISGEPGTISCIDTRLLVVTGDGVIEIIELKPQDRAAMSADSWLRGHKLRQGQRLT